MDSWYENIGGKIKFLAKVIAILGAFLSIVFGIALMLWDEDFLLTGLLIVVLGDIVSWILTWFLYGYGQLIEHTEKMSRYLQKMCGEVPGTYSGSASSVGVNASGTAAPRSTPNSWKCTCGRVNPPYQTSCVCGGHKNAAK